MVRKGDKSNFAVGEIGLIPFSARFSSAANCGSYPRMESGGWPDSGGRRVVFLLDASGRTERRLLGEWIERHRPAGANGEMAIPIPPSRRRPPRQARPAPRGDAGDRRRSAAGAAARRLAAADGRRRAGGAPARPADVRRSRATPARCASAGCCAGTPNAAASSPASRRRSRSCASAGSTPAAPTPRRPPASPSSSPARRRSRSSAPSAACAARATRCRASCTRTSSAAPAFRGGIARLAARARQARGAAMQRKAASYLREIAATHSPYVIDLDRASHPPALHARLRRDPALRPPAARAQLYALASATRWCSCPRHKSNLDHLVLQYALHENGHPPNHTAGGINMNFFPVGPLVRRSGVFFIRRTLQGQRRSTSSSCSSTSTT